MLIKYRELMLKNCDSLVRMPMFGAAFMEKSNNRGEGGTKRGRKKGKRLTFFAEHDKIERSIKRGIVGA